LDDLRIQVEDHEVGVDTINRLVEHFLADYDHNLPLTWFGTQLEPVLGIDVYANQFPHADGYDLIEHPTYPTLVLKAETSDEVKTTALRRFLSNDGIVLSERENVGEAKWYDPLYRAFREGLVLPDEYVERMLSARYTRHFYTANEIEAVRARWQPAQRTVT